MAREPRDIFGTVKRTLPATSSDGGTAQPRTSNRGELMVAPISKARCALADEGSYFVATNPTPGTGVAGIAAADGLDDTEAFIVLRNNNTVASGKRIYLDRLKLRATVAGTNGTNIAWASKIDEGDRYTSGGSAITPVNCNLEDGETTGAEMYAGALVTTAASSAVRLIDFGTLRTVIVVAGDEYVFDFGGDAVSQPAGLATAGTAQLNKVIPHAPVVLTPGDTFWFSPFAASQTVASQFEFQLSWWER